TLRHLLEYMLPRVGGMPVASAPAARGFSADGHGAAASTSGYAAPLSAAVASLPAVAGGQAASAEAAEELTSFLIDFVVEQTGYPREIVELDADLESDLGIDSIRKAQLFGEIGQKHGLSADASVSLDDFRTLRHLLEYMLPRVGGMPVQPVAAVPAAPAAPLPTVPTPPARSAAYQRACALAGEQSAAIRSWARQLSGTSLPVGPSVADEALLEQLAGSAAGAGLTADLLQVALLHPEAACGGCDRLVVSPAAGARASGLAVSFGRHAQPAVEHFQENGLAGTLVGIPGLPGALAGWNSAGLLVVADTASAAAAHAVLPAVVALERLVRQCCTLAEVGQMARHSGPFSGGLIAMSLEGGGCLQIQPDGRLLEAGPVYTSIDPRAGMARIALADGALAPADGLAALLATTSGGSPAAMSAACTWLAVGICGGTVQVVSGGPLMGANWLQSFAGNLGAAFVAAATRQRSVVSGEQRESAATGVAATAPITRRYALTLQDLPATRASRALTGQRVLILAAGALADPLKRALEGAGAHAILCTAISQEEAVAAIEAAEAQGAVRHFIVATPWADGSASWPANRQGSIVAPYFACQRWIVLRNQAADMGRSTLTAIANLGGDFGLSGAIGAVEGGALAGLFKGLAREFSQLHVRVVDFPAEIDRNTLAHAVVAEVRDGAGPVEVGYRNGRRQTVVPCERPRRELASALP
ncbi:MAG: phosphopantetheine-binding protein, partial [Planctomycetota bacterium]